MWLRTGLELGSLPLGSGDRTKRGGGALIDPAFLFSAIRCNRVRQKNTHAQQTKKCCYNLDH